MPSRRDRGRSETDETVDRKEPRPSIRAFREQLTLDRNDLDNAAFEQPSLFYEVSEQVALSQSRRDELKLLLEQEVAEVDAELRRKYVTAEKKPTDTAIGREIEVTKSVIRLKADLAAAVAELAQWNALKESFSQRNDMIKVSAQLYASNYFTRNSASASARRIDDREADEVRTAGAAERRSRMKE